MTKWHGEESVCANSDCRIVLVSEKLKTNTLKGKLGQWQFGARIGYIQKNIYFKICLWKQNLYLWKKIIFVEKKDRIYDRRQLYEKKAYKCDNYGGKIKLF